MNSNAHIATARDIECAIAAGGMTMFQLRMQHPLLSTEGIQELRYFDPITDYWIPRGVLLFRIRPEAVKKRDVVNL